MRFSRHKDLIAGVFLFVVALVYFILSFQVRLTNIDRLVGSRFFPQICGVLLMLFSILLIAGDFLKNRALPPAPSGEVSAPAGPKPVYRNTVLALLSFALYIVLMDLVGFTISTLAYLFSQMALLQGTGRKKWLLYGMLSLCSTIAIYYLFNNVFLLMLPKGTLL